MVSYTDCSYKQLKKIADKLGFKSFQGRKHCKIKNSDGVFITMIPRHSKINKETAKGIINDFSQKGNIPKKEIEKLL